MILKEQEKLRLSDKLSDYFEDDILKGLHTFKGKDYSYDLTLADLLFHKSGLSCWFETGGIGERVMKEDFEFPFEKQLANVKSREAKFAPGGKKAEYSDINFGLLGKVIEKISGRHISKSYQEYIIKPLGLNNTSFISNESLALPIWFKDKQIHRPKFLSTHGEQAVVTTADELMIFLKAFFTGKLFNKKIFDELSVYTIICLYEIYVPDAFNVWWRRILANSVRRVRHSFYGRGRTFGSFGFNRLFCVLLSAQGFIYCRRLQSSGTVTCNKVFCYFAGNENQIEHRAGYENKNT